MGGTWSPCCSRADASRHRVVIAAALGAAILYRYYWFFEWNTDDGSQARQAYLASVIVAAGIGPGVTMLFLGFAAYGDGAAKAAGLAHP